MMVQYGVVSVRGAVSAEMAMASTQKHTFPE